VSPTPDAPPGETLPRLNHTMDTRAAVQRSFSALLALPLALLLGAGCQTYRDQSGAVRQAWVSGQHETAAKTVESQAKKKDGGKDAVIWHLEAGTVLRALGRYEDSNVHFAKAAERIEDYEAGAEVRLGSEFGALMSNPQNLPYQGRAYDKIMLHTYRALNFLALGDLEKARPELIRAYQRQQDAVAENARRIEKAREAERQDAHQAQVRAAREDPGFQMRVQSLTANLQGFSAYADYVNPFTVWLEALYFLHAGAGGSDRERALMSFNRVAEVAGDNAAVREDAALLDALTAGSTALPDQPLTYVIFETGRAASRAQERIDIPIIIADVSYIGAAFPRLEFHKDYLSPLSVSAGGHQVQTRRVASMDAIIAEDFRNEWPVILTKTLLSTAAKGAAAYAVNTAARRQDDMLGLFVRIATAVAQAAVNIADTRTWSTLPKEFQVARLPTPEDRVVRITGVPGQTVDVQLIDGTVNVVYVRSVTSSGPLLVTQFKLR
jgi:uncharacterized protein